MRFLKPKHLGLFTLACLLVGALVSSGCSESVDPAQRIAVSDVMRKFEKAMPIPYLPAQGEMPDDRRQRYIEALRDISVSECPEDFQRAWNEHLAEVIQRRSEAEVLEKTQEIMDSGDQIAALVFQQRENSREMEAMGALWQVAAKYDRASARLLEESKR